MKLLNAALHMGERPTDSLQRKRALRLFNGCISFVFTFSLLYIFFFIAIQQMVLAKILVVCVFLYGLNLVVQWLGYFTAARLFFLANFNIGLSIYHTLTDESFSFVILYLVFVTSANLFTLNHEKFLKVLFAVVPTAFVVFHETTSVQYLQPLVISDNTTFWLRAFLVPTFVLFFIAIEYYITVSFNAREEQLLRARNQAESADRTKSEFLSLMSHELRTPINAISFSLNDVDANNRTLSATDVETLKNSVKQLEFLVSNFVDFRQLTRATLPEEATQTTNVPDLLSALIDPFKPIAIEKGLTLALELGSDIPPALAVRQRLFSITLNHLIENALRFSDQGEVVIRCHYTRSENQPKLTVSVSDQGIGIPDINQKKIFDPFYQMETVTKREKGGTGLGLAICQQCVKQLAGELTVQSTVGVGSSFSFSFIAKTVSEKTDYALATQSVSLNGLQVLVVDDNPVNQKISRKYVERLGANVETIDNGTDAVERCRLKTFDLVIMDLHMPTLDGFETTRQIKKTEYNRHTPVIAFSADTQTEVQHRAFEAGMSDFIEKPLHMETLRQVIHRTMLP